MGFNSLQTGKAFRTQELQDRQAHEDFLFQFPSNGKGFPNPTMRDILIVGRYVSIPFKRERLSEPWDEFACLFIGGTVSIPFKRERLSELYE